MVSRRLPGLGGLLSVPILVLVLVVPLPVLPWQSDVPVLSPPVVALPWYTLEGRGLRVVTIRLNSESLVVSNGSFTNFETGSKTPSTGTLCETNRLKVPFT